jgi:hypothetical protein
MGEGGRGASVKQKEKERAIRNRNAEALKAGPYFMAGPRRVFAIE